MYKRQPYRITRYGQTHRSKEILDNFEALDGQTVSIAGRMMSRRVMGKASFAHVLDRDGQIQIYVRRDDVGEEAYKQFKAFDLGDVIGVCLLYTSRCVEETALRLCAFSGTSR